MSSGVRGRGGGQFLANRRCGAFMIASGVAPAAVLPARTTVAITTVSTASVTVTAPAKTVTGKPAHHTPPPVPVKKPAGKAVSATSHPAPAAPTQQRQRPPPAL